MLLSSAAAIAATGYGAASCRMFTVTYTSTLGCFEDQYFNLYGTGGNDIDPDSSAVACKNAIGLYQWLKPNSGALEWDDGSCVGYSETARHNLSDALFETARVCGVLTVLLSFVVFIWVIFLTCLAMNRCQVYLFRICCFAGTLTAGLTFILDMSQVCNSLFESQSCEIDSGGMSMAAACILWFAVFVLSIFCVKPSSGIGTAGQDLDSSNDALGQPDHDRLKAEVAAAQMRQNRKKRSLKKSYERRDRSAAEPAAGLTASDRASRRRQIRLLRLSRQREGTQRRSAPASRLRPSSTRTRSTVAGSPHSSNPSPASSPSILAPARRRERITVDDVNNTHGTEVYISRRPGNAERMSEC